MENIKKFFDSKALVKILHILVVIIIAMSIFYAGTLVGFQKASYGRIWSEHYNQNFGMGRRNINTGMMGGGFNGIGMMNYFPNAHGATGKIIKIELPSVIVQDKDNTEKVILIKDDTKIQIGRTEIKTGSLKMDDFIIVIGAPNEQGQIEAKLIRVIPRPEFLKQ